ncbi:sirohydrochlorin chelatase [Hoeflea sp. TYP-13]|uniref:sirohydrochlorin chelatase n=1 Tax=Hoeflea sp. TYP-13 TaxID=3230023 RepID=UPI0034C5EA75
MSGTRSASPMAPATENRSVLVVAHGSPSKPEAQDRVLAETAGCAAACLPGWTVRGATLAGRDTLEAVAGELQTSRPLVYPLFMSDGWFVRKELSRRLRALGLREFEILAPLGLDPAIHSLCRDQAHLAAIAGGCDPMETTVVLAAHGSLTDHRPRAAAQAAADKLCKLFKRVSVGFLDETPRLSEAAKVDGQALCLPYFAGRSRHVETDVPAALEKARFSGPILDPVGIWPQVPRIIAAAVSDHSVRMAA